MGARDRRQDRAGQTLRLLTNDLDAPAQEIADLYKRRWRVELFFRVMKKTLKITRFVGRSENAVRIQIAVALIAFPSSARPATDRQRNPRLPRTRSTRARQPHAPKRPDTAPKTAAASPARLSPARTLPDLNLNRTAVAQGRPSTRAVIKTRLLRLLSVQRLTTSLPCPRGWLGRARP